jgi:hypothetical protein
VPQKKVSIYLFTILSANEPIQIYTFYGVVHILRVLRVIIYLTIWISPRLNWVSENHRQKSLLNFWNVPHSLRTLLLQDHVLIFSPLYGTIKA